MSVSPSFSVQGATYMLDVLDVVDWVTAYVQACTHLR